jgi:hypothetical protein
MTEPLIPRGTRLASEPGQWEITLVTGEVIWLLAHGFAEDDEHYVFSLLMDGEPPFEVDSARLPASIVTLVDGG